MAGLTRSATDRATEREAGEAGMPVTRVSLHELIDVVARRVIEHADHLTALDAAIGDGDHGINMKRGLEAVLADIDGLAAKPLPEALKAIGLTLVMKVGGASGPLYGTLLMALGRELPESFDRAVLASAFGAAVQAVKARGKSDVGAKTMLDVLEPVRQTLEAGGDGLPARVRAQADAAAAATVPMKATRGRASFLGDRSVGHMDPGARSSALMIGAVCDVLEGRT
jgi:phosphoenolpyruvate---glycerone phosphotransferase subunit DhaL